MPSSRESGRSRSSSNEDEEFLLIVSGLPRHWRWQEFKDFVRKWAPQVKHAYTNDKVQTVGGVGVITVLNKAKAKKAYEGLSGRMVEGRPLSVEIRTSTGETLAGPTSYGQPSTSSTIPPRAQVISPSVVTPSSVMSALTTYHVSNSVQTQAINAAPEMQANYNPNYTSTGYHPTPVAINTALSASPDYTRRTSNIQARRPSQEDSWYPASQACLSGQVTTHVPLEPFGQQLPPILPSSPGYMASMSPTGYTTAVPLISVNTTQPMLIPLHENVIVASQGNPRSPPSREAPQDYTAMPNPSSLEAAPNQSQRTIYIQNVHYQATWKDLKDHLRGKTAGHVDHCRIFNDESGRSRGRGIAIFRTTGEAEKAVRDLDGKKFQGKRLKITLNEPARREDLQAPAEQPSMSSSAGRGGKGTGPVVVDGTQLVERRKGKR